METMKAASKRDWDWEWRERERAVCSAETRDNPEKKVASHKKKFPDSPPVAFRRQRWPKVAKSSRVENNADTYERKNVNMSLKICLVGVIHN